MAVTSRSILIKASGTAVSFSAEATTASADFKSYQITNTIKRVWSPSASVTVERSTNGGSTWSTEPTANYTLDRLFGKVIFPSTQNSSHLIRVSGSYLPISTVAEAHGWKEAIKDDPHDVTPFNTNQKKYIYSGIDDLSGSLEDFDVTKTYYKTTLRAGTPVVLEYSDGVITDRYWALLNEYDVEAAIGSPQNSTVGWTGTPDIDGRVTSSG